MLEYFGEPWAGPIVGEFEWIESAMFPWIPSDIGWTYITEWVKPPIELGKKNRVGEYIYRNQGLRSILQHGNFNKKGIRGVFGDTNLHKLKETSVQIVNNLCLKNS